MSLNGIVKERQIPGKGNNETLEIVNPMEYTTVVTEAADGHVPENGGTCICSLASLETEKDNYDVQLTMLDVWITLESSYD
jgi:hypothetical protein